MSSQTDLKELGERLHRLLLEQASLIIPARITEVFLPELLKRLPRILPTINDQHLLASCADDALLAYLDHPERFDPARSSLLTYLSWLARSRVLNELKQKKSTEQQEVVAVAESETVYGVAAGTDWDESVRLSERETEQRIAAKLRPIITDPTDRQLLELMLEGVRETSAYAAVLGITEQPPDEQRRLVKQHKDRVRKRVRRKLGRRGW
jgi:RNA polymerase sigma-70 factor (ECF subfamily)